MNRPLQDFSPANSNYERPTHGWACGKESEGQPCSIGTSSGGDCQVYLECVPARVAGGYVCARAQAFGGKCEKGPLPDGNCCQPIVTCHPRRTLFARRRVFTTTLTGLALGVLLCIFGGNAVIRNAVTSPGALTLQHASIYHKCETCHDRAVDGFDELMDSLTSAGSVALTDSDRCRACHRFGPDARRPHSLSTDELTALTEQASKRESKGKQPLLVSLATQLAGSPMDEGQLACSRCHKEHRGEFFDLTQMADAQCQICHTSSFHGFSAGHPEFSEFPYTRRTRIQFDHATHYGNHFVNFQRIMPEGRAPKSCQTCHKPDLSHQTLPLVDFGQACGSCHGEQLYRNDAITLLALPILDPVPSDENQLKIGEWPDGIDQRSDARIPAFMRLLLESDESWAETSRMLQAAEQAGDATNRSELQVRLAWATKKLIGDLISHGSASLERRLAALPGSASQTQILIQTLAGEGTLLDAVELAASRWFPNLQKELDAHSAGQTLALPKPKPETEPRITSSTPVAGWNVLPKSVAYLPSGHADRTLQTLIDALVGVPDVTAVADGSEPTVVSELFSVLTDPGASFRCMGCHTIDTTGEKAVVNWYGRRQASLARSFVRFSHAPHVTLLSADAKTGTVALDGECTHCHQLQDYSTREDAFFHNAFVKLPRWTVNTNPHSVGTSGFGKVQQDTCVTCHTQAGAGESCLKCHNYHVGLFPTGRSLSAHPDPAGETDKETPEDGSAR